MSVLVYVIAYLAIAVFGIAVVVRFVDYLKKPIHVRWELYPVAHEGKRAEYGGGYLEEVDWWQKKREVSHIGELKVMIPEILLLKAVWEHNRPLWFVTYPFHLGLYLLMAFIGLLGLGAILQLAGVSLGSGAAPGTVITNLAGLLGPLGFIIALIGALGLFFRRLTNEDMRAYSGFGHFFNLAAFILATGLAIAVWLSVENYAAQMMGFMAGLLTFGTAASAKAVGTQPLFAAHLIVAFVLMAYIPLTHMSHFFMKYFLYHDIRWGDEPNINTPHTDAKIQTVLNYPVSWAAGHIAGHGRTTWAEVATFNPARDVEEGKEK